MVKIILILGLGLSCFANNINLDICSKAKEDFDKLNQYIEFLKEKKDFEKVAFFSVILDFLQKIKEIECKQR